MTKELTVINILEKISLGFVGLISEGIQKAGTKKKTTETYGFRKNGGNNG